VFWFRGKAICKQPLKRGIYNVQVKLQVHAHRLLMLSGLLVNPGVGLFRIMIELPDSSNPSQPGMNFYQGGFDSATAISEEELKLPKFPLAVRRPRPIESSHV
jgi:hypothetical protein